MQICVNKFKVHRQQHIPVCNTFFFLFFHLTNRCIITQTMPQYDMFVGFILPIAIDYVDKTKRISPELIISTRDKTKIWLSFDRFCIWVLPENKKLMLRCGFVSFIRYNSWDGKICIQERQHDIPYRRWIDDESEKKTKVKNIVWLSLSLWTDEKQRNEKKNIMLCMWWSMASAIYILGDCGRFAYYEEQQKKNYVIIIYQCVWNAAGGPIFDINPHVCTCLQLCVLCATMCDIIAAFCSISC